MAATYGLRFGSLDYSPSAQVGEVAVQVFGILRGKPVPVVTSINSLIQDGGIERVEGHENRDQQLIIAFRSSDSMALAGAERDLFLECQKPRNELAWTPPDGIGPTTVFDVLWADPAFTEADDWDLKELRGWRAYLVTLRCRPFGRSVSLEVDTSEPISTTPVTVTIADGSTTAGWLSTAGDYTTPFGDAAASSGWVTFPCDNGHPISTYYDGYGNRHDNQPWHGTYTFASPVDFSATPYLSVDFDWGYYYQTSGGATVLADGVPLVRVGGYGLDDKSARVIFYCDLTSVSQLQFDGSSNTITASGAAPSVRVGVTNLVRTNQGGNLSTTGRESVRTIHVGGSARTEGSLIVASETEALRDVIVYTCPALSSGYAPDLVRWRVAGGVQTADGGNISGYHETMDSTPEFNVPLSTLPRGGFLLMGRLLSTTGSDVTARVGVTFETKIGSSLYGSQTVYSDEITVSASEYGLFPLVTAALPTVDVAAGASGVLQITVGSFVGVEYDEMWLFYLGDDAALSVVDCGANTRLWLDTATVDRPIPSVWMGTNVDRGDAVNAGTKSLYWGAHSLPPGDVRAYLATSGARDATLQVSRFKRWHTHAAED